MKIAYITTFSPQPCGIATYTEYLINGLRKLKKDLSVRVISENKAEHYKNHFIEVLPAWNRFNDYSKPIIKYSQKFDVIHLQHEFGIFQFDNRIIKTLNGLNKVGKKIVTFHCIKPQQFANEPNIEAHIKAITNLVDLNIVHLPAQQAVLTRLGIEQKKIKLIPHGTELINIDQKFARQKLSLPIDGKVLLMFGFVKPHKGYEIVLDSLREIIKYFPDTYFFIAGTLPSKPQKSEIEYLNYIKQKIGSLHLTEKVIFPNKFFSNQDVPTVIAAADIVLFPYYEPDFSASGALHLSIGAKKPVIASRIPKFDELKNISDELLVLPHNSQQITALVLRLFEDNAFLSYVIKKTDSYRKKTSWQHIAKKHLEIYLA